MLEEKKQKNKRVQLEQSEVGFKSYELFCRKYSKRRRNAMKIKPPKQHCYLLIAAATASPATEASPKDPANIDKLFEAAS